MERIRPSDNTLIIEIMSFWGIGCTAFDETLAPIFILNKLKVHDPCLPK